MTLKQLVARATDKGSFSSIESYVEFSLAFLDYVARDIQEAQLPQRMGSGGIMSLRSDFVRHAPSFPID